MGTYLDDVGFALTLTNLKPKFDALAEQIGDLDQLDTTAKTDLVAAVNEVLATANKKLDLIQLEPTHNRTTVDIPTGGCVLVVTAIHAVTLTFNGNAGDLVILVNNTTGSIRNTALSPVLPSNNIAVILMDGEHTGQSLFRTDVIPDSVEEVTGELENLSTTAKTNLVAAINEVANGSGGFEDLGDVDIGTDGLPAIPYTGASRNGFYTFTCTVTGFLFSTNSGTSFWDVMIYKDNIYTRIYSDVPLPPPTWTIVGSSGKTNLVAAINEVNENAIITKTREGATSTDMGLISNLPIYTTDGGQIEYSGVFGDDKEVIPLINLILKWGTNTYKTTLFQSRYQSSTSSPAGHIHQMLYWNDGETGIVPITRSIEINNQNETYWGVWTDCNGKEYSDLA